MQVFAEGSTRGQRRVAAFCFLCVNVTTVLLPAVTLTGAVWSPPRFTFKHINQSASDILSAFRPASPVSDTSTSTVPDEYEACERVRFHSFVRAPCNAFTSLAYLSAPVYQIATNEHMWAGQKRGLRGLAAGFGLVSIVLGTALAHASFLYHASATVEMNRLDVRCMMLFLIHNTLKCIFMSSRHVLHKRWGGPAWRRELRDIGLPFFGEVTTLGLLLALATNMLNDHYDVLLAVTVTTMLLGSCAWAVLLPHAGGGLGRGGGLIHLVLFVAGVLLKVLDDSKILCVGTPAHLFSFPLSCNQRSVTCRKSSCSNFACLHSLHGHPM